MNASISIDQIRKLPVAEQLALVEQIWDGLHASRELVRDWQIDEARRRTYCKRSHAGADRDGVPYRRI